MSGIAGELSDTLDRDVVARACSVLPVLTAQRQRIEQHRELTPEVVRALHDQRLFRLLLPRAIGGDAVDPVTFAAVTETLATADASTAWCVGQGGGCAMAAAYLRPDVARRLFGPADAVLAWGAGIQGRAVAVPGGYRVTGRWTFASGSRHATLLGGHSYVLEADGRPRLRPDGRRADRTVLVPRAKARIDDMWHVVGLKGTGSDTYALDDVLVPEEETIDRENAAERQAQEPVFRMSTTLVYAAGFASLMLGIARGAVDDLTGLAMTKTQRGATLSMRESPAFQTTLARMEARLRAARAYHFGTLESVWLEVERSGGLTLEQRGQLRLSATHAINEGTDVVVEAYRAAGQNAIFEDHPLQQRMRDALSASQQAQGRPTHYTTVGRMLLGLEPDTTMFT